MSNRKERSPHRRIKFRKNRGSRSSSGSRDSRLVSNKWSLKNYATALLINLVPVLLGFIIFASLIFNADKDLQVREYRRKLGGGAFTIASMFSLWALEVLPMAVVSCFPLFFGPLLSILDSWEVISRYITPGALSLVASITVSLSVQYSNLNRRLALTLTSLTGTNPKLLLLSCVVISGFLSMVTLKLWLLPTMVVIVMAVVDCLNEGLHHWLAKNQANKPPEPESGKEGDGEISVGSSSTADGTEDMVLLMSEPSSANFNPGAQGPQGGQAESSGDNLLQRTGNKKTPAGRTKASRDTADFSSSNQTGSSASNTSSGEDLDVEKLDDSLIQELAVHEYVRSIRIMLLLAVTFASAIGGTGLVTGTGPNFVLLLNYQKATSGRTTKLNFWTWASFAFPSVLLNLTILYAFLWFWFYRAKAWWRKFLHPRSSYELDFGTTFKNEKIEMGAILRESLAGLGCISLHEILVIILFLAYPITITAKHPLFYGRKKWDDVGIFAPALMIAIFCFITPKDTNFYRKVLSRDVTNVKFSPVLDWNYFRDNFSFEIIIFAGGCNAMSRIERLGHLYQVLFKFLGSYLESTSSVVQLLSIILVAKVATEASTNFETAQQIMPFLFEWSRQQGIHPLYFTFPGIIVTSYVFMFPMGSYIHLVSYMAGRMKMMDMLIPGFFISLLTSLVLWLYTLSFGELIFEFKSYQISCLRDPSNGTQQPPKCHGTG